MLSTALIEVTAWARWTKSASVLAALSRIAWAKAVQAVARERRQVLESLLRKSVNWVLSISPEPIGNGR
jgi:hypothetical protein